MKFSSALHASAAERCDGSYLLPPSATGVLGLFAEDRSLTRACARARRPVGRRPGSGGLPFAALRVPCDARLPGLWPNSLRSLRSLRSNRRPQACSQGALRARPGTLRFSAAPIRPTCVPPAALPATMLVFDEWPTTSVARPEGGAAQGRLCAAEKRRSCDRARSAHRPLTRRGCLSAVSAANEASSATGPQGRASQGTRSAAKGKHSEPLRRTALGPARKLRMRGLNFGNVRERVAPVQQRVSYTTALVKRAEPSEMKTPGAFRPLPQESVRATSPLSGAQSARCRAALD